MPASLPGPGAPYAGYVQMHSAVPFYWGIADRILMGHRDTSAMKDWADLGEACSSERN